MGYLKIQDGIALAVLVFLMTVLAGCGSKVNFGIGQTGQSFTQSGNTVKNQLDILWVVDNSSSMTPLQNNLTSNFSSFISTLQTKGYDFHIAVTTTDAYLSEANFSNNPALAQFSDGVGGTVSGIFDILTTTPNLNSVFIENATTGVNGSGDERAFSSMRDALNSSLNSGFLRSNSFLAVIILSDEDDFSGAGRPQYSWLEADGVTPNPNGIPDHDYSAPTLDTVQSYVTALDTLTQSTGSTRRYNVSAITVLDQTCLAAHAATEAQPSSTIIGQRYIDLANDTNGILGSICDASYGASLAAISNQITTLSTQFFLTTVPNVSTLQVYVDKVLVPEDNTNGWSYSADANSIQFHGTATPAQGAVINVDFTPTTVSH